MNNQLTALRILLDNMNGLSTREIINISINKMDKYKNSFNKNGHSEVAKAFNIKELKGCVDKFNDQGTIKYRAKELCYMEFAIFFLSNNWGLYFIQSVYHDKIMTNDLIKIVIERNFQAYEKFNPKAQRIDLKSPEKLALSIDLMKYHSTGLFLIVLSRNYLEKELQKRYRTLPPLNPH